MQNTFCVIRILSPVYYGQVGMRERQVLQGSQTTPPVQETFRAARRLPGHWVPLKQKKML